MPLGLAAGQRGPAAGRSARASEEAQRDQLERGRKALERGRRAPAWSSATSGRDRLAAACRDRARTGPAAAGRGPSRARSLSTASWVASGPSIIGAGSPGMSLQQEEADEHDAQELRGDEGEARPSRCAGAASGSAPTAAGAERGARRAATGAGACAGRARPRCWRRPAPKPNTVSAERQAREERRPPLAGDDVLEAHGDHAAPFGRGRPHAGADED